MKSLRSYNKNAYQPAERRLIIYDFFSFLGRGVNPNYPLAYGPENGSKISL